MYSLTRNLEGRSQSYYQKHDIELDVQHTYLVMTTPYFAGQVGNPVDIQSTSFTAHVSADCNHLVSSSLLYSRTQSNAEQEWSMKLQNCTLLQAG